MANDRWRSGKKKQEKPKKKLFLTEAMRQYCKVEVTTSEPEEDYMDVTLTIRFMNGFLKDKEYKLNIDRKDYHEVW